MFSRDSECIWRVPIRIKILINARIPRIYFSSGYRTNDIVRCARVYLRFFYGMIVAPLTEKIKIRFH